MGILSGVREYVATSRRRRLLVQEPDSTVTFSTWFEYEYHKQEGSWVATSSRKSVGQNNKHPSGLDTQHQRSSELVLLTWNINAFADHPHQRMAGMLSKIRDEALRPNVIFLQEVSHIALEFLLADSWVRENWYSSEADATNWGKQAFATIILLSKHSFSYEKETSKSLIDYTWRVRYPSRFERDALGCDVLLGPQRTSVRLVNVHLDSLPIEPCHRPRQLSIVAKMLHNTGQGVVAGDFNPVSSLDTTLIQQNRLVDAWMELHPSEDGFTWGIDGQQSFPAARLDKVALVGLRPKSIHLIHPVEQNSSKASPSQPWSDHSGLLCVFELVDTFSSSTKP